jgi:dihydrofolate reductase
MGTVVYSMGVSLDGYMEGPNHELDWHIFDEELQSYVMTQQRRVGAYLWGRRVYEHMAAYWSIADQDPAASSFVREYAGIWKNTPKIVFSRTLKHVEPNTGDNVRLLREVTPETVARLKTEFGQDLSVGGADLAASFMRLGLIDEYGLSVQPIILGRGTPFFPQLERPIQLRLIETRRFTSGVVYLRYQPAGSSQ